jgi:hypothetical protein
LVAIKVMHDHIAEDPSFSAMFRRGSPAAQIAIPTSRPLDVADDGGYIVMEYRRASLQAIRLSARDRRRRAPIALRIFLDAPVTMPHTSCRTPKADRSTSSIATSPAQRARGRGRMSNHGFGTPPKRG